MSHSRSVDDPFLAAKCWTQIISKWSNHEKIKFGSAEVDGMQFIFYPLGYRDSTEVRSLHSQILDVQRPSSELLRAAPGCSQGLLFLLSVLSLGSAPQHRISLVDLVVRSDLMSLLWGYCEPTSTYDSYDSYDSYDHKGAHFVMPRGEHQVQLERGQPKTGCGCLKILKLKAKFSKVLGGIQDESRWSHCEIVASRFLESTEGVVCHIYIYI